MEDHSKRVQPIAVPVWLIMKPSLIPPFSITPKRKRKHESSSHRDLSALLCKGPHGGDGDLVCCDEGMKLF